MDANLPSIPEGFTLMGVLQIRLLQFIFSWRPAPRYDTCARARFQPGLQDLEHADTPRCMFNVSSEG